MGIKEAIQSLITRCQAIPNIAYVRVWNNQFKLEEDGQTYDFPKPAIFIEARTPNQFLPLGGGFSQSDITFVFHLIHEQYDAGDGTMDQNLDVYTLKSSLNVYLTLFKPTQCTPLLKIAEIQDYNHTNLYHYQLEYLTGLIDTDGVPATTLSVPPTTLIDTIQIGL